MTIPEIIWGIVAVLGWLVIAAGFINEAARRRRGIRLIPLGRGFFYVTLPVVLVSYLFFVYVLILVFVGVPEGPADVAGGGAAVDGTAEETATRAAATEGPEAGAPGDSAPQGALAGLPETIRVIASFLSTILLIAGLVFFMFATPQRLAPLLATRRLEADDSALKLLRAGDGDIEVRFDNAKSRAFLAHEPVGLFAPGYQEREVVEVSAPDGTMLRLTLSPDEETSVDLPAVPEDDVPCYRVFRPNDQAFLRWCLKTYAGYRPSRVAT